MTQTADTARQILTTYVASIERKKLRLINFMAAYGEDTAVFDKYSLTILNTYIKSLRDQVSHMETNWDTMRGDGSLSLVAFMEISPLFEQAQTSAEEILDQADTFCIDQAKIVDPPRNRTNCSTRSGEDQADSTTQTYDTIREAHRDTSTGEGVEQKEQTMSLNPNDTTTRRADGEIWTPLTGWIRDPGIDPHNELNPGDPEDGHQNYPFCYKIRYINKVDTASPANGTPIFM
jgi:hypothetical protein